MRALHTCQASHRGLLCHNMNSVFFHGILLTYLFATLLLWFHLGLRQPQLFWVANGLLGVGCGLPEGHVAGTEQVAIAALEKFSSDDPFLGHYQLQCA